MTQDRQRQEAAALVGLAVAGWAFPGVLVRLMPHLPPFPLVALRLSMAFLALLPALGFRSIRVSTVAAAKNWRCWTLSLSMLLYYLTATPAFLYAPVGEVALVIASAPLFAVILRLLGRQPVTRVELAGTGMAIVGVLTMTLPSIGHSNHKMGPEWLGILLAITAAIMAAAYAIGNRHLLNLGQSPGAISQVGLTFFLGLFLLPSVVTLQGFHLSDPRFLWFIPLGAFSTAIPTVAVAASSHRLSPIAVTMINPLCSACASIVAAVVIHEIPSVWTLIGGTLIVVAVFVAARPAKATEPIPME